MIDKKINSPMSSSCGRLFDSVAALINLCTVSKFHAEAPMKLESIINTNVSKCYSVEIPAATNKVVSFKKMFEQIIVDMKNNIGVDVISAKFHNTIIDITVKICVNLKDIYKLETVALSGGTFQNRYLLTNIENKLTSEGFRVLTHSKVPSNDGGISLGQLAIAASKK